MSSLVVMYLWLFIAGFSPRISGFITSLDSLVFVVDKVALGHFRLLLPVIISLVLETLYHQELVLFEVTHLYHNNIIIVWSVWSPIWI
jgi:ABC-type tungstate transport system substrate-binding protein